MTRHLTKHFGEIDLDNPEDYYETKIELNGKPVEMVMNICNSENTNSESIQEIDTYIDNIKAKEEKIRIAIKEDFKEEGEAKNYVDFQIEGQEDEAISKLIAQTNKNITKEEQLLSTLYLLAVNFYPDKEDKVFAVYDYTIEEELTDDLLVVIISKDNRIKITIES